MSAVDDARNAVNSLITGESSIEDLVAAYAVVVKAGASLPENDRLTLLSIIGDFRAKIPLGNTFQRLRDFARLFEQDLAAKIIGTGMANIAARNAELQSLLAQFGGQINATNASANKLPQIKENIDKATKAVKTARDLFSTITNADASKTAKLQAVIKALEDLDEIF